MLHCRFEDDVDIGPALSVYDDRGEIKTTIVLDGCVVDTHASNARGDFGFVLMAGDRGNYAFGACTEGDRVGWVAALRSAIDAHVADLEAARQRASAAARSRRASIARATKVAADCESDSDDDDDGESPPPPRDRENVVVRAGLLAARGGLLGSYYKRKVKLVAHKRDRDHADVGPSLQFYDLSGSTCKGEKLLDGCEVYGSGEPGFGFSVVGAGAGKPLKLRASSAVDRKEWIDDLRRATADHARALERDRPAEKARRRASIQAARDEAAAVADDAAGERPDRAVAFDDEAPERAPRSTSAAKLFARDAGGDGGDGGDPAPAAPPPAQAFAPPPDAPPPGDASRDMGLVRSGFLSKKGALLWGKVKTKLVSSARDGKWVDVGPALQFFWDKAGRSLKAQLVLDGCEVYAGSDDRAFSVVGPPGSRTVTLKAASDVERRAWMGDLESEISAHARRVAALAPEPARARRSSIKAAKAAGDDALGAEAPETCTICWRPLPCRCEYADGSEARCRASAELRSRAESDAHVARLRDAAAAAGAPSAPCDEVAAAREAADARGAAVRAAAAKVRTAVAAADAAPDAAEAPPAPPAPAAPPAPEAPPPPPPASPPASPRSPGSPRKSAPTACVHDGELRMWCEGKARFFRKAKSAWKPRSCRVLTHCRDGDGVDVGPALEYGQVADADGSVVLGVVLLDGCGVWTSTILEGAEDGFTISDATKVAYKFAAPSEFAKTIWINSLAKAIADHKEELRAAAPGAVARRRSSIAAAKRLEAARALEQEEVVLAGPLCLRRENDGAFKARTFQLVTHGRDAQGDDVGPKLLFYDSRGRGALKGAYLLDGCAVALCARAGRCDFGFDVAPRNGGDAPRPTLHLTAATDDLRASWVDHVRSAVADHAATLDSLAPKEKAKRRRSIDAAAAAERDAPASPPRPRAPPAAVALTSVLSMKHKGLVSSSFKSHKFKLVTHCRDGNDDDIGPVIQYMSLDGKTFHGAILLDGATVEDATGTKGYAFLVRKRDAAAGKDRADTLKATTRGDRDAWTAAIARALAAHAAHLAGLAPVEQARRRASIDAAAAAVADDFDRPRGPSLDGGPAPDGGPSLDGGPAPAAPAAAPRKSVLLEMTDPGSPVAAPAPAAPPPAFSDDELRGKSVRELKRLMADLGVDAAGCFDKDDLVDALAASGRVDVAPPAAAAAAAPDDARDARGAGEAGGAPPADGAPPAKDTARPPPAKQSSMSKLFAGARMIVESSSDDDAAS